ncbi:hypothetical protein QOZ94_001148 [Xanthobacter agilis]|jgi:hypothetical protein|uniref:Uncharacterized protein n=1 Tax=Xanthobacter agilis TaxID=47492 RepID=A0ABU0LB73_XANAG|nr:hypothetical protein [Xanthobacter agilis]
MIVPVGGLFRLSFVQNLADPKPAIEELVR